MQARKRAITARRMSADEHVKGMPAASAGVDKVVVNKGFLYALLGEKVQIIVTHPSPYVFVQGLLASARPEQVAEVHRQQLNVLHDFIEDLLKDERLAGIPIFVAGDLNINRYAVKPETDDENDP